MMATTLRYARIAGITGLLASVSCGWQLWWLMMWGVWGAPPNPLHGTALIGALALLVSSIVLLSTSRRRAAVASLIAEIVLCVFYAPASVSSIADVVSGSSRLDILSFVPPILLLTVTVFTALAIWSRQAAGRGFEVEEIPQRSPGD